MTNPAQLQAAMAAATTVLEAADFTVDAQGKAWAEPGDMQVLGFSLPALVRAVLATARPYPRVPSPVMIAAAWTAWQVRHPPDRGRLGPGPGFVEALQAAFAAAEPPEDLPNAIRQAIKFAECAAGTDTEFTADDGEVLIACDICANAADLFGVELGSQEYMDLLTP